MAICPRHQLDFRGRLHKIACGFGYCMRRAKNVLAPDWRAFPTAPGRVGRHGSGHFVLARARAHARAGKGLGFRVRVASHRLPCHAGRSFQSVSAFVIPPLFPFIFSDHRVPPSVTQLRDSSAIPDTREDERGNMKTLSDARSGRWPNTLEVRGIPEQTHPSIRRS